MLNLMVGGNVTRSHKIDGIYFIKIHCLFLFPQDSDVAVIEKKTRDQAASHLWHNERSIRITASNVATIVNMKTRDTQRLAASMVAGQGPPPSCAAITWGRNYEPEAIKRYEAQCQCVVP